MLACCRACVLCWDALVIARLLPGAAYGLAVGDSGPCRGEALSPEARRFESAIFFAKSLKIEALRHAMALNKSSTMAWSS